METRLASLADVAHLAALHAESFGEAAWNLTQITESLALPTTRGWIAQKQGITQGFILCQFSDEEAEILTFCVTPQARRRGIARQLLNLALAEARQKNMKKIFLEAAADNEAAITLYEKTGFERTGQRKNYYRRGSVTIDALMLTLCI